MGSTLSLTHTHTYTHTRARVRATKLQPSYPPPFVRALNPNRAFNSAKQNTLEKQPEEVLRVLKGAEAEDAASKGSIEMSQVNALHSTQWAGSASGGSAGAVAWK